MMNRYTTGEAANVKAYGRFTTGNTVTISVYKDGSGTAETLTNAACSEVGATGIFYWSWSNLNTAPIDLSEYVFIMTNGRAIQVDSATFGGYPDALVSEPTSVRHLYHVDFALTSLDGTPIIKGDSFTIVGSIDLDLTGYTARALLVDKYDSANNVEKLGSGLAGGDTSQIEIRPNSTRSEFDINFLKGDTDLMGDKAIIEIQFDNIADPTVSKSLKKGIDFIKQEITD